MTFPPFTSTSSAAACTADSAAKKHRNHKRKTLALFAPFVALKSVNQNQNRRVLRLPCHLLKPLIHRIRFFRFGFHIRHGFQEW
jgi:hypothetical protein